MFLPPCALPESRYINPIQHLTAPPHGFVRPGPFLSLPGHGPIQRNGPHVWQGAKQEPRRTSLGRVPRRVPGAQGI